MTGIDSYLCPLCELPVIIIVLKFYLFVFVFFVVAPRSVTVLSSLVLDLTVQHHEYVYYVSS